MKIDLIWRGALLQRASKVSRVIAQSTIESQQNNKYFKKLKLNGKYFMVQSTI